jgi:signal transduction histidine kinase
MLLNLINDLLDLAKIENMKFNFNTSQFNLHEIIQKALDTLNFSAQQKNITMSYIFDEENAGYLMDILGDDNRYLQILLNFLSNALKFTNQNGKVTVQTKILDT